MDPLPRYLESIILCVMRPGLYVGGSSYVFVAVFYVL